MIEATINFSPMGTSGRGEEMVVDPHFPVAENLCFFLGTSSTLFFPLSLPVAFLGGSFSANPLHLALHQFASNKWGLPPLPLCCRVGWKNGSHVGGRVPPLLVILYKRPKKIIQNIRLVKSKIYKITPRNNYKITNLHHQIEFLKKLVRNDQSLKLSWRSRTL